MDKKCNEKIALKFLNEFGELHYFTCIHPHKKGKTKIINIGYKSLEKAFKRLQELNQQGYGVFFCTNDVHGKRRLITSIESCRCIFQEDDDGYGGKYPVEPTIVVQSSPGKFHRYWLLKGKGGLSIDQFYDCQSRMVSTYGCDKNAFDAVRVLRVPGFYHTKVVNRPVMVEMVGGCGVRYKRKKLIECFPVEESAQESNRGGKKSWGSIPIPTKRLWMHDLMALGDDIGWIKGAVEAVSTDAGYWDWVSVGMALKARYGDRWLPFSIWDKWSMRNLDKYNESNGRDGLLRKWQSFDDVPVHGSGIGIGTIFNLAHDNGYENDYTVKDKFKDEEKKYKLGVVNEHFGTFVAPGGKPMVIRRKMNSDGVVSTELWSRGGFVQEIEVSKVMGGKDKDKPINLSKVWLSWSGRRQYTDMIAIGHKPVHVCTGAMLPKGCTTSVYESFTGMTRTPRKGDCSSICDHIYNVWCNCNVEAYRYVLGWLSNMLMEPWKPAGTCLTIVGGQGAGKGIILEPLVRMMGNGAFICTKTSDLGGRFNWHLYNKFLIYGNEITWGGNRSEIGTIKSLITDRLISYEEKGVSSITGVNCTHLVLSSNSEWVTHMDMDDRRFVTLRTNDDYSGNLGYFDDLARDINNGGMEAFIWYLMNERDDFGGDEYRSQNRPETDEISRDVVAEHKIKSGDGFESFWGDVLEDEEIEIEGVWGEPEMVQLTDDRGGTKVHCVSVYKTYLNYCRVVERYRQPLGKIKFYKKMREVFGITRIEFKRNGVRVRGFRLSRLSQMQEDLNDRLA
jgi:hypothetical protein